MDLRNALRRSCSWAWIFILLIALLSACEANGASAPLSQPPLGAQAAAEETTALACENCDPVETPAPFPTSHPTSGPDLPAVLPSPSPVEGLGGEAGDPSEQATPTPGSFGSASIFEQGHNLYESRSGDTAQSVAARFQVEPDEVSCFIEEGSCITGEVPPTAQPGSPGDPPRLLPSGTWLILPVPVKPVTLLLPDSEIIFSRAASGFDTAAFLEDADGYMHTHRQYLMFNGWNTGADVINMVATENSINPRLLIALLEYQCGCILGFPGEINQRGRVVSTEPYLGAVSHIRADLYGQLTWAVDHLSDGYYGWRAGTLTSLQFLDGKMIQASPALNAATFALQYVFAMLYPEEEWEHVVSVDGFYALYEEMLGDPWSLAVELFPDGTAQPKLILPFPSGGAWSFTGGPHAAFEGYGPLASLDFAPPSAQGGCVQSNYWVTAVANGPVVRVDQGVVIQDLDGDGLEQTGWTIMYMHIENAQSIPLGTFYNTGDRIGHPSCEGGRATGTHLHIARKFNGEWIPADSPLPMVLSGWHAVAGKASYLGYLVKGDQTITACTCANQASWVIRTE